MEDKVYNISKAALVEMYTMHIMSGDTPRILGAMDMLEAILPQDEYWKVTGEAHVKAEDLKQKGITFEQAFNEYLKKRW